MKVVAIPAWTAEGVLPPNDSANPVSRARSPYPVSLTDFVLRYGSTEVRRAILVGFLQYREALHAVGIVSGFQWLDGSFLEDVETLAARDPRDIDVVTFYRLPAGTSQGDLLARAPELFDLDALTTTYKVDGYLQHLGTSTERLVSNSTYWYSVWAHRRDGRWKGFVALDLDPNDDLAASALLATLRAGDAP